MPTVTRRPRMQGRPPMTSGSRVIRFRVVMWRVYSPRQLARLGVKGLFHHELAERPVLGRPLHTDEVQHFTDTDTARRIAAILLATGDGTRVVVGAASRRQRLQDLPRRPFR